MPLNTWQLLHLLPQQGSGVGGGVEGRAGELEMKLSHGMEWRELV